MRRFATTLVGTFVLGVLLSVAPVPTPRLHPAPAVTQPPDGDSGPDEPSTTVPPPGSPPTEPGTARPQYFTSPPLVPGQRYDHNFPDPYILRAGGSYYAYATTTGGRNLPVLSSTDLFNWFPVGSGEAMPNPPSWAIADPIRGPQWGPSVVAIGGRYVAYSAWEIAPGRRCISAAAGPTPAGPFVDRGSPLQCDWDPAGSIDPEPFLDTNGQPYLLWKSQGEVGRTPTSLWSRQLARDGLSFTPTWPTRLLTTELGWEQPVIENPSMVVWQGIHYLVYSAGLWESANYAMGVARCVGPSGPCIRSRDSPLIPNDPTQWGAGGGSFFLDAGGRLRLAYHAWNPPHSTNPQDPNCDGFLLCGSQGRRALRIAFLDTRGPTLDVRSSNPFGNVDLAQPLGPAQARVAGWAIDPDTSEPIRAHLYVNGRFVRATTANLNRPDIGRAFPGFGNEHGYDLALTGLAAGRNEICVYGINTGPGGNPLLACRTVTVTAATTTPTTEDPQSNLPATPSTLPPTTGSSPPATTTDPSATTLPPPTTPAWTPPG